MRIFRSVLTAVLVAGLLGFSTPVHTAGATAWNPRVTLQGKAFCGGQGMIGAGKSTWVWVEASNGEHGWATSGTGAYKFAFKNVPLGTGMTVTVKYGSRLKNDCVAKFGLKRPSLGTSATVNVKQDHWFWY
jgi:hypothetical protein